MAMTKKEIFAKYGIEFKEDKIRDPYGIMKPLFLKAGNTKVGKKTATWSMPAGSNGTCACDCTHCYAKEGHYKQTTVIDCLAYNQKMVETEIDFVKRAICAQIEADKIELVRIHAAGDFKTSNQTQYAAMWCDIIELFPHVRFWTYTKIEELETLFDNYENANIVKSLLPLNLGVNYGTCKELLDKYAALKHAGYNPHICACGTPFEKHCDNCQGCSENEIVLFILHSCKGYNPQKDDFFPAILNIIRKQEEE